MPIDTSKIGALVNVKLEKMENDYILGQIIA